MNNLNEKCGVFGIYAPEMEVARLTYFGLFALQHRGQESSGIAVSDGKNIFCHKDQGLVSAIFTEEIISGLKGHIAIGHNRYSTSKGAGSEHVQPVWNTDNTLALAHNGNLPSTVLLEKFLNEKDIVTLDFSDSRMMAEAIGWHKKEGNSLFEAVQLAYPLFTGAFSFLVMTEDSIVAGRDSKGMRPLSIGLLENNFIFSSETCALSTIGATHFRDVLPGEIVLVDKSGLQSKQIMEGDQKLDIFEFIYFSRHDSSLLGKSVYEVRKNLGKTLAKEYTIEADIVIGVPETSIPVAMGYSEHSGIKYEMGLNKNRYIQRTFIQPDQKQRDKSVRMKLSAMPGIIQGKRVIVIDDSIVRGTTSKAIVELLFDSGASEVHFLVSSPPIIFPDFYGIDTPKQSDLFAFNKSVESMREYLGATSLYFITLEGLLDSTDLAHDLFNTSCFTGIYPIELYERKSEFASR